MPLAGVIASNPNDPIDWSVGGVYVGYIVAAVLAIAAFVSYRKKGKYAKWLLLAALIIAVITYMGWG